MSVSERIKFLRKKLGLNQTQFVEPLGITQAALSAIEGGGLPSLDTLEKISNAYNKSIDWLVKGTEKPEPPQPNIEMLVQTKIAESESRLMEKLEQIRDAISDIKIKEASEPTKVKHRQKH